MYIYIIYTPNSEFSIVLPEQIRKHSRFIRSSRGLWATIIGQYGAALSRLKLFVLIICGLNVATSSRLFTGS